MCQRSLRGQQLDCLEEVAVPESVCTFNSPSVSKLCSVFVFQAKGLKTNHFAIVIHFMEMNFGALEARE